MRRSNQTPGLQFVFPQLGSLPVLHLFTNCFKHLFLSAAVSQACFNGDLPDSQVPSFVSVVQCMVTGKHELIRPLSIVHRLQSRLISLD